jgi:hypothetical protein
MVPSPFQIALFDPCPLHSGAVKLTPVMCMAVLYWLVSIVWNELRRNHLQQAPQTWLKAGRWQSVCSVSDSPHDVHVGSLDIQYQGQRYHRHTPPAQSIEVSPSRVSTKSRSQMPGGSPPHIRPRNDRPSPVLWQEGDTVDAEDQSPRMYRSQSPTQYIQRHTSRRDIGLSCSSARR